MDWQPWIDEGLIEPDEGQRAQAAETIAVAWEIAQKARAEHQADNLAQAEDLLRQAFLTATIALIQSEGYSTCTECDLEFARATGERYFGATITQDLFSRLDDINGNGAHDAHAIKRGVVASATYAAVVGSRLDLD